MYLYRGIVRQGITDTMIFSRKHSERSIQNNKRDPSKMAPAGMKSGKVRVINIKYDSE